MELRSLSVKNFRNIKDAEITGLKKANLVTGGNAQGKTNFLESIYYLSTLSSNRMKTLNDLISIGESYFSLRCKIEKGGLSKTLDVYYGFEKETAVRVNENPVPKKSEFIGELKAVKFSPEDIDLIKRAPVERRRNINLLLSQISRPYLSDLSRYHQVLAQKNKLLFQVGERGADKKLLSVWNAQLVETGARIVKARLEAINSLKDRLKALQLKISGGKEIIELSYKCSFDAEGDLAKNFEAKLQAMQEREIIRKASLVGPHRDDLVFILNGRDAKYFSSEGQQRSIIINLKLAEYMLIKEKSGEEPVVLIDDIFFDLDETRRSAILSVFNGMAQVFLAGTEDKNFEKYFSEYSLIKIGNGRMTINGQAS
ncbi:MAG: DNA replication/repair protein RecF [Candidatus Firestonebacteria bacterium]